MTLGTVTPQNLLNSTTMYHFEKQTHRLVTKAHQYFPVTKLIFFLNMHIFICSVLDSRTKSLASPKKRESNQNMDIFMAISTSDRDACKASAGILTFPDHTGGKKITGAQDYQSAFIGYSKGTRECSHDL